jgi:hypothetical protein
VCMASGYYYVSACVLLPVHSVATTMCACCTRVLRGLGQVLVLSPGWWCCCCCGRLQTALLRSRPCASTWVRAGLAEGYSMGWWRSAMVCLIGQTDPLTAPQKGASCAKHFADGGWERFFVNSWLPWCPQGGLLRASSFLITPAGLCGQDERLQAAAHEFAHTAVGMGQEETQGGWSSVCFSCVSPCAS